MLAPAWLIRLRAAVSRLLPATLFGRLALLLFVAVLASHLLALTVLFELRPGPQWRGPPPGPGDFHGAAIAPWPASPPGSSEPPRPPPPPGGLLHLGASMLLDIGVRLGALMLAAWVGARWLSRPISRLAHAARELGQDVHRPPLPEEGAQEFREASRVFNQMQAQLRRQLEERDRFVAAVSHDLRTPLTRLRLRAESLADPRERRGFQQDIEGMEEMIRATLDYLRGAADEESFVLLDVGALVTSLADDHPAGPRAVRVEGAARAVRVQPSALRRAIGNLVDNAIRYGEQAHIRLRDEPGRLCIEVNDRGPGIPPEQLEQVFEPFYRLESSRNRHTGGVGLGLAIARDIARRQGGSLTLRNLPRSGLQAVLELPRR
ncbi:HAMP domain-containing protein [Hylemonella gracilis]|uniref:histidine kinase n=1 Tax=Hylemonella gracilis TaxID=80880 RepID=A0A4P6UKY4_9BURK|nr:ATP-binding protein [Hylemonella gracilis]QBK04810.1 HAMP domain-containing protein [Hylemonella gracilis]